MIVQQGNALQIDPRQVVWKRCVDMNDRVLRNIVVGLGNKMDGMVREDHFVITVASEIMAILCLADDLADLKHRLGRIIVAYNFKGEPVTADDLQATGAMAALLKDAIKPNLIQTLEHTPALLHGGPFANIAHGCNSVKATKMALKLSDIAVTEAGFGADLGAEKFMDIKCRKAGLKPDAVVLVATGRPWTGVPEELRELPGMDYALTANGARIIETRTGKVLEEHLLSKEAAKKAIAIGRKYDTLLEVYFDGQGYAQKDEIAQVRKYHKNPNMWDYFLRTRIAVDRLEDLLDEKEGDLDKVQMLFADMEEREEAWKELEREGVFELVGSLQYNIEINAVGVNKGTGLVNLGKMLGIRREEIMACGDGDNDIAMLKEVGFGVAMANAEEKVKAVADYITESNNDEGAAKAIEKFVLKRGGELC